METALQSETSAPASRVASTERLRIVALTHRVPFPPDKGDKIRTYHLLSRLARRAEVHLLCLADPPEDLEHVERLRARFASVTAVPIRMSVQKIRALPHLLSATPLTLPVFRSTALERALDEVVARVQPAAFYAESSSMAPYALRHSRVPLVMDFVDVDSEKWRSIAAREGLLRGAVYAREAWALARYERLVAARATVSTLTASRELALFQRVAPGAAARVLENGVDTDFFTARDRDPGTPSMVFFGAMDYVANVDAAVYLVRNVLPRVRERFPDATVVLAGSRPAREVSELARVPGVTVTGFVPDIRPHVQGASLSVCPLRVARGVQNKVLEAMAMGVPVLASPAAAEGIEAEPGREIAVARDDDDGRAFADAACALLGDLPRRVSLAQAARERVVARYGWQPRSDELFELLQDAAGRGHSLRR